MAIVANSEDYAAGYEPEKEAQDEQDEPASARTLNMAKDAAIRAQEQAKEKIAHELFRKEAEALKIAARQWVLNRVKIAFAATLIGLIITYLVMTWQMIFGNILKLKFAPSLPLWEQIVWGCVSLLILFALLLILMILSVSLYYLSNPIMFLGEILNNFWQSIIGKSD